MLMWYQPKSKTERRSVPRRIRMAGAARSPSSGLMPKGTFARPKRRVAAAATRITASPAAAHARPARVEGSGAAPQRAGTSKLLPARIAATRPSAALAIQPAATRRSLSSHSARSDAPATARDSARHAAKSQGRRRGDPAEGSSFVGSGGNAPGAKTSAAAAYRASPSQKERPERMIASPEAARTSARAPAAACRDRRAELDVTKKLK